MQTENWARVFRDAVIAISQETYDYRGPRDQRVFPLLDQGAEAIRHFVPFHYWVRVSQGIGARPRGLWIAVLDSEVTETPTKGVYVVYLFDEDRRYMYLSLNQGVTQAGERARTAGMQVGNLLRLEAMGVRTLLAGRSAGLDSEIRLGAGSLLRRYEAGNIVSKRYELARLQDPRSLVEDLARFLDLYAIAVADTESALAAGRSEVSLPPRSVDYNRRPAEVRFEPRDASDYRAHINAQEQVRSRSHERLVASLAEWTSGRGFTPNNNVHPRDLVLHKSGMPDVLVEVKVFPAGRPREGVRTAIGQLFEYQRFYHREYPDTRRLVALSEYPGDAYCELLESLGIGVVWPHYGGWHGSDGARQLGLMP